MITSVHNKFTPNIYTISRFIKKLLLKWLLPNFGKINLNNCCITFVCLKYFANKCISVVYRTTRLGNKGIVEVQNHLFFKNDQWDFSNIRDCVPPIVCELSGEKKNPS